MVCLVLLKNLWFRRFRGFDFRCCSWLTGLVLEVKTCEVMYPLHCSSSTHLKICTIFHQNLTSSSTFFALNWADKSLYIWYSHCTHKDISNRQFDPEKPTSWASNLSIEASYFWWFLFTFCYFFLLVITFVIFFLLLKGGEVSCFNLFFHCWMAKEGEGQGSFLFSFIFFSFDLLKGEGRGGGWLFFLIHYGKGGWFN
jgi:hypothetical protein